MPPTAARADRSSTLLMGGAWGIFVLNALLVWILPEPARVHPWLRVFITGANALAFYAALRLARSGEAPHLGWSLWAAQLGWLLAMRTAFAIHPQWKEAFPRLPWGQPYHLVSYVLGIFAFLDWGSIRTTHSRLWVLLEDLLFALGGFFLVWTLGLRDFVEGSALKGPVATLLMLILLCTSLTVGLWANLFLRPPPGDQRRLAWIGLGLAWSLGRNALLSLALRQGWTRLTLEADALDAFTWLCWAQAFLTPRTVGIAVPPLESRFRAFLPYLPALLALGAVGILLVLAPQRLDWQVVALLVPVVILLLWRQWFVMQATQTLARTLEVQVAQRTQSLEEAQSLLLQTERMNTVASLGAGLAHDLNNLIGVSKNYAELMEQDLREGRMPELQDARRIQESTAKAGELTAQLMAFGRQQGLQAQVFDLREHLESRRSLFRMVARPPVDLLLDSCAEALPILMDPSQVDQLLVNLLSNARDAMPKGGHIWVRTRRDGTGALLEVQDEGTGMPESVRQRIFDPFFTTKPPGRGTGLGLASVKALVEQASGSMEVESEEGRGTTFRLRFPLQLD